MKLSEAIRIGSAASGQAFGAYQDQLWKRCALGAAYYAVRGRFGCFTVPPLLFSEFPILNERVLNFECPGSDCHGLAICASPMPGKLPSNGVPTLFDIVLHLNDFHSWDRLKIADWVASFEKSLGSDCCAPESPASVEPVVVATTKPEAVPQRERCVRT